MTRKSGRNTDGTFGSGNPGKPKGARHKATTAALALLDGQAEALTQKAIETALAGDTTALRLCLDRIAPPGKDTPVSFTLPPHDNRQGCGNGGGCDSGRGGAGRSDPTGGGASHGPDRNLPPNAGNLRP